MRRAVTIVVAFGVAAAGSIGLFAIATRSPDASSASEAVAHIATDGPPQPIAADDVAAWAVVGSSGNDVVWRIDGITDEARELPETRGAMWPATGEGYAWATACPHDGDGDGCPDPLLLQLDPSSGVVVARIPLPGYPSHVATGFGSVWVSTQGGLARVDVASRRVVDVIDGSFGWVAIAGTSVWASERHGVARIDPLSSDVTHVLAPEPCVMVAAAGSVWTATCGGEAARDGDTLIRIDAAEAIVAARIPLAAWGHLVGASDALWLIQMSNEARGALLTPLDLETGAPGQTRLVPFLDESRFTIHGLFGWTPFGAASTRSLWITDFSSGAVTRVAIDAIDGLSPVDDGAAAPSPEVSPSGYLVELPSELALAPDDPNGGGALVATTNLPEGTQVVISYEVLDVDGTSSVMTGTIGGTPVRDGEIRAHLDNGSCMHLVGQQGSSPGVRVTVTVSPSGGLLGSTPFGSDEIPDTSQPEDVLAILGERFEHLDGPQVHERRGDRELVAERAYPWPAGSCDAALEAFMPESCPSLPGQLQGDRLSEAMGEIMGAITQARLCDLWQLALTADAERAHPWEAFRTEWSDWVYSSLVDVTDDGDPVTSALTWDVVAEEPSGAGTAYTIDLELRGARVATFVVTSLPDWPDASDPGVVPFWELTRYELVDAT